MLFSIVFILGMGKSTIDQPSASSILPSSSLLPANHSILQDQEDESSPNSTDHKKSKQQKQHENSLLSKRALRERSVAHPHINSDGSDSAESLTSSLKRDNLSQNNIHAPSLNILSKVGLLLVI